MSTATVNNLIEEFIHLPLDDKEYAAEVIQKQLIEAKREAIFRKQTTKSGTAKELYKDLDRAPIVLQQPRDFTPPLPKFIAGAPA
jgi:hypothetical protein